MKRRRSERWQHESFGTSLADILTTALGCVLLLFLVVVLNVRTSLFEARRAQAEVQQELTAEQRERLEAERRRALERQRRAAAEAALQRVASARGEAEQALQAAQARIRTLESQIAQHSFALQATQERLRALEGALGDARAAAQATGQRLEALRGATRAALKDLDPRTASPVDVVLVIDGTRSMAPSLEATRRNLVSTIKALRVVSPTARVGVVVFRDRREPPALRLQSHPLTDDEASLKRFLDDIDATSTAVDTDRPEWLCGGIAAATEAGWRPDAIRLMIVVSDAAAQGGGADCVARAMAFRQAGGQIHVLSTHPPGHGRRGGVTRDYRRNVLPQHRAIAEAGGGIHVEGADADALLTEVLHAAYRERTTAPVERLREAIDERGG